MCLTGMIRSCCPTMATTLDHGRDAESGTSYLVLPDLGVSLEAALRFEKGRLSTSIVSDIAVQVRARPAPRFSWSKSCQRTRCTLCSSVSTPRAQVIEALRDLHVRCNMVYRDLKPANIMIEEVLQPGETPASPSPLSARRVRVWLVDLGLARTVTGTAADPSTAVPARRRRPLVGNARFASLAAHHGCKSVTSPADDLESLGYLLSFLLRGTLPWIRPEFAAYIRSVRA
jgi:serine/threonine protein kinase